MQGEGGGVGGVEPDATRFELASAASGAVIKLFVLDTNVILHDAGCIFAFHEHDVAVPITVLEELDRFKRGNGDLNAQARAFLRQLDGVTGDVLSDRGAALGEGLGRVRVILGPSQPAEVRAAFLHDSPDHRILGVALGLRASEPGRPVVLISKDMNLRLKARSLGLVAQDYTRDKVQAVERLYTGKRTIEHMAGEQIDAFFAGHVPLEALPEVVDPRPNESFVLRNGSKSVLATFRAGEKTFRRVEKRAVYGVRPRNAEQSFAIEALMNPDIELVTLAGRAGTGKTLLALAAALEQRRSYRQILLARPVVALGNRDLGFLPGDVSSKLDPYMQPLFDNLNVIRSEFEDRDDKNQNIQKMLESDKLVVTPLAYIRGRSLPRVFFIVDEAQNLTPHEVKTIITRAGEGTKIVFTGDIHQIDQPYLDESSNGLSHLISRMVGQPLYAHVTLEKCERSRLAERASALL